MQKNILGRALPLLALTLGLMIALPAWAVIARLTPLREVLRESQFILVAKVKDLDATKPAMVLTVEEDLKGKAPFRRLPVVLKGDSEAAKHQQTAALLKRLAPKMPLVLFVTGSGKNYIAFAYSNGTWFQMTGVRSGDEVRWRFTHAEPYLRRTFSGTTAALQKVVADGLANRKKPPEPNAKEKPGLGPEIKPVKKESGSEKQSLKCVYTGPMFAVIPTVFVGGPLAMLAMFFPAVFGGWKRWLALLSVAGTNSTLYSLQWWFKGHDPGAWWTRPYVLWISLTLVTLVGAVWAWRRHLLRVESGEAPAAPGKVELIVLGVLSLLCLATVAFCLWQKQSLLSPGWMPVLAFSAGIWAGTLYVAVLRRRASAARKAELAPVMAEKGWGTGLRRPPLATEAFVLTCMAFAIVALAALQPPKAARRQAGAVEKGEAQAEEADYHIKKGRLVWTFKAPEAGLIASSPLVAGDRVYVTAALGSAFHHGALYCLDRKDGKLVWTFGKDKSMKQAFSSPVLMDGKLYFGEGFHQDSGCKIYCVGAADGKKVWEFSTGSHVESSPCVAGGRVYCGAGDEGLYCLDAATGKPIWNFPGFHIDANPVVVGDRLYVGAGVGDQLPKYQTAVFCLNAKTGKPSWQHDTKLPVWGEPVVAGGRVYQGVGNGRFNESADNPAGALLCLDAADGKKLWEYEAGDAVLARPTLDHGRIFFGSRDRYLYCVNRAGKLVWKKDLGSEVVTAAALARCPSCGASVSLFAAASDGRLFCLAPATGTVAWQADLPAGKDTTLAVYSSPALTVEANPAGGEMRRVYVGSGSPDGSEPAAVHCYEDQVEVRPED